MFHPVGVVIAFTILLLTPDVLSAADVSYNRDIRPILSNKCFACHGPDGNARQAELRLDVRESAERVLSAGKPEESDLLARVDDEDPEVRMPPPSTHKRVTKREAAKLRQWIEAGAEYEPHWSFIPPGDVQPPRSDSPWVTNEIDQFVLQRLTREKLTHVAEADRRTLIRRVTLDLTGLPPTPEEVDAFVADPDATPLAYERVVDRLLASPRYAEHIAYPWLDAARYGDSDGYESDPLRNMWPWRDWVVEAFDHNMPYDRFLVEQLAGDMLPNASLRQQLATGFNRNHRLNNEGGILPEEWQVEYVCDRAEATATVFMGLTWGCARCHDHKFDPITQRDYYRLFAFFNNLDEKGSARGDSTAEPMLSVPRLDNIEKYLAVQRQFEPLQARLDEVEKSSGFDERYKHWLAHLDAEQIADLPKELQETPREQWNNKLKQQARRHFLTTLDPEGTETQRRLAPVQKQRDALLKTGAKVMVMRDMEQPRQSHILNRGVYDQPGEPVEMGTPDWLPPMDPSLPRNRLGLAQWLVDPAHPLTARVAVNRFWQLYFGVGLVKTQEDFGAQGEPPVHHDLLDWLSRRFIDSGWDVKALQKLIVMSSTYRQESRVSAELLARDPENRLLARGPRYRLPAAVIRDQALTIGGLLVNNPGGAPSKPYQPDGLWQEIIKGRPVYEPDSGQGLYRRSLYTLWRRAVKPPLMVLLDANERDTCQVSQRRTNTPLQALLLLNDVTFVEASRGLASRLLLDESLTADAARLDQAMRLATGRMADDEERDIFLAELSTARQTYAADAPAAGKLIATGASAPPESLDNAELAAWTVVSRIILNLDEVVSKQ